MSLGDALRIWAEGSGQSKQKTIRTIWPELAAALDGKLATAGGESEVAPQPLCTGCGGETGKLAIGRADADPVCGQCACQLPYAGRKLTRVSGWLAGRAGHPAPRPRPDRGY